MMYDPWYIRVDEENIKILTEWRKNIHDWHASLNLGHFVSSRGFKYTNFEEFKFNTVGDFKEITTEDFKREILKEEIPSITEDYIYLIDLFKKLKIK